MAPTILGTGINKPKAVPMDPVAWLAFVQRHMPAEGIRVDCDMDAEERAIAQSLSDYYEFDDEDL